MASIGCVGQPNCQIWIAGDWWSQVPMYAHEKVRGAAAGCWAWRWKTATEKSKEEWSRVLSLPVVPPLPQPGPLNLEP